jgi:pSer/pThr/pTyr-binding forkhead associated (FHA) protein
MSRIILRFKDKNLKAFPLNKQSALTIGRRGDNHVVIENLAVSGHHAKIIPHEKGYVLADLKSKNGTFVNGRRIKTYLLKHKDVVTVGKHLLIYDHVGQMKQTAEQARTEEPSAAAAVMAPTDQTMFMDTRRHRQLLGRENAEADLSKNKARPAAFFSFLCGRS